MSKYKPVHMGLSQIGRSPEVGKAALDVARRVAGNANAVGDSEYDAKNTTVRAGWANEARAGAMVYESKPHGKDWQDRVLLRMEEQMTKRVRK